MFAAFLLGESCLLQVLLVTGHNIVRLVRSLEMTLSSPNIPPEILATLLNLVSFSTFFDFEDIDTYVLTKFFHLMFSI